MTTDNRIGFWGSLDESAVRLEEAVLPEIKRLWEGGEYRMRPSDIERMEKYLERIRSAHAEINKYLDGFRPIAVTREI